jgi:hypothetical protein
VSAPFSHHGIAPIRVFWAAHSRQPRCCENSSRFQQRSVPFRSLIQPVSESRGISATPAPCHTGDVRVHRTRPLAHTQAPLVESWDLILLSQACLPMAIVARVPARALLGTGIGGYNNSAVELQDLILSLPRQACLPTAIVAAPPLVHLPLPQGIRLSAVELSSTAETARSSKEPVSRSFRDDQLLNGPKVPFSPNHPMIIRVSGLHWSALRRSGETPPTTASCPRPTLFRGGTSISDVGSVANTRPVTAITGWLSNPFKLRRTQALCSMIAKATIRVRDSACAPRLIKHVPC